MKYKANLVSLTDGKYYSLAEAAKFLDATPDEVYRVAKKLNLGLGILFHKFTVYSIEQLYLIRQEGVQNGRVSTSQRGNSLRS